LSNKRITLSRDSFIIENKNQDFETRRHANWVLLLLTVALTLNFLDRSVISVLLDLIKRDLMLSDTMLGLIAGFGFALVYAVLGLPFARLADITSRRKVIAGGMLLWSFMTVLGGFARTGGELALTRVGVGAGEAAGTAASHAMLSENFSKDERPRVLSILNLGAPIGVFLGVLIGGWVAQYHGWRVALFVCGFPGLIVAIILLLTTRDRLSPDIQPIAGRADESRSIYSSLGYLFRQRSYALSIVGTFFSGFGVYALYIWMPAFFGRVHGLSPAEQGTWVGGLLGLSGIIGVYLGGWIVTRFSRGDDRWKPGEPAVACLASMPFLLAMLFVEDWWVALALMAIGSTLLQALLGPIYSVYQVVAPPRMRSLATSVHNLVGSLGGLGMGALIVGALSDSWQPDHGLASIRYALVVPFLCLLPAAFFYFIAMRYIREDVARAS
jgi:predicted MFS family arabinose efflux permease